MRSRGEGGSRFSHDEGTRIQGDNPTVTAAATRKNVGGGGGEASSHTNPPTHTQRATQTHTRRCCFLLCRFPIADSEIRKCHQQIIASQNSLRFLLLALGCVGFHCRKGKEASEQRKVARESANSGTQTHTHTHTHTHTCSPLQVGTNKGPAQQAWFVQR